MYTVKLNTSIFRHPIDVYMIIWNIFLCIVYKSLNKSQSCYEFISKWFSDRSLNQQCLGFVGSITIHIQNTVGIIYTVC